MLVQFDIFERRPSAPALSEDSSCAASPSSSRAPSRTSSRAASAGPRSAPALTAQAAAAVVDLAALRPGTSSALLGDPAPALIGPQPSMLQQAASASPIHSYQLGSGGFPAAVPSESPTLPAAPLAAQPADRQSAAAVKVLPAWMVQAADISERSAHFSANGVSLPVLGTLEPGGWVGDAWPYNASSEQLLPPQLLPRQSSVNSVLLRDALGGSLTVNAVKEPAVDCLTVNPAAAAKQTGASKAGGPADSLGSVPVQQPQEGVHSAAGAATGGPHRQPARIDSATFSAMAGLAPPISFGDYVTSLASEAAARQP